MTKDKKPGREIFNFSAAALLGLALILNLSRYAGITHDSMLYFGQAMMAKLPHIFGEDLFFLYGSQADYSLFPKITGWLFNIYPAPQIFLWGTLISLLAFASAGWFFLSAITENKHRYWAWICIICLPSRYAETHLFSYGEQFFTSRPIAESLCLLGAGLLARGHTIPAVAIALLAGAFHPLQTIGALLIAWPWLCLRDRRYLHLAWLSLPIAFLALIKIHPFSGLIQEIDPAWLKNINENTGQLLLLSWSSTDFGNVLFDALLLFCGFRTLGPTFGRWCISALIGLAAGLASNLILVDLLHLALPAGLQLWRVHWLAHWFAMAALALLILHNSNQGNRPRLLLLLLIAHLAWTMPPQIWTPLFLLYFFWENLFSKKPDSKLPSAIAILSSVGIAIIFANYVSQDWTWFKLAHYRLDIYAIDRRLLAFPAIALTISAASIFIWRKALQWQRNMLFISLLIPATLTGAARWDSRPWINSTFENSSAKENIFGVAIPENSQVYWDPETFLAPWMVLNRASYYSGGQLGGGGFDRRTSIEGNLRASRMITLIRESTHCQDRDLPIEFRARCHISNLALWRACATTGSPSFRPDYLVLRYKQPQRALGTWRLIDPKTNMLAAQYWLYRCDMIIADLQADPDPQKSPPPDPIRPINVLR